MTESVDVIWERYHATGDAQCRSLLCQAYYDQVQKIAQQLLRKLPPSIEFEDLTQEGMIALLGRFDCFDPSRGVEFMCYASSYVYGAMMDYVRRVDWVPRHTRNRARCLNKALAQLRSTGITVPQLHELQAVLVEQKLRSEVISAILDEYVKATTPTQTASLQGLLVDQSDWYPESACQIYDQHALDPKQKYENEAMVRVGMDALIRRDRELISKLFFEGQSIQEVAAWTGVYTSSLSVKRKKLLTQMGLRIQEKMCVDTPIQIAPHSQKIRQRYELMPPAVRDSEWPADLVPLPPDTVYDGPCRREGCPYPVSRWGFCQAHIEYWFRCKDPTKPRCSVEFCDRIARCQGMCDTHYSGNQRLLRKNRRLEAAVK